MKSLEIRIELATAIEMPKYPIHLDGLLYWALGGNLSMLNEVLEKEGDVYKASSMCLVKSVHSPITYCEIFHPTQTHWLDWQYPVIKKGKSLDIEVKGGPYRKRMTSKEGIVVPEVLFHATGNAEKIRYLLESLGFIGLSNNQGYGEITNIQISEIEKDFSFFDEAGKLARILPIGMVKESGYLIDTARYKPPYIASELARCAIPNLRVKVED